MARSMEEVATFIPAKVFVRTMKYNIGGQRVLLATSKQWKKNSDQRDCHVQQDKEGATL